MVRLRILAAGLVALVAAGPALAEPTKPPVIWKPAYSGNYTKHSGARDIDYVVIHVTEGTGMGAASWFQNPVSKVSAHYIVQFSGTVQQCVADKDIAWHAGNSYYNAHSIGIEHAGHTYKNEWTEAQYKVSARLTRWLCFTYGIPIDREHIVAHFEVPGATHTDPGPFFRWDYYLYLVRTGGEGPALPSPNFRAKPMTVATDLLNVRRGPSAGTEIFGKITAGQVYVSPEINFGWRKIYYDGKAGWCHGAYLAAGATGGVTVKVTAEELNVRSGPGSGYTRYGRAYAGQLYWSIGSSAGWRKIWFRGSAYWVYGGYVVEASE